MSLKYILNAFNMKVGSAPKKLILIKLADNANDSGECWPSYQHIADHCEMSRSCVRKHIKELEAMGLLTLVNRKGEKGNSSNLYKLFTVPQKNTAPVSPEITPVSPESIPPVPRGDTRTCHSNEPVNEPYGCLSKMKSEVEGLDQSAWKEWLEYKKQIKSKYNTERGEKSKAAELINLANQSGLSQTKLVNAAIDNEWKGFYLPKTQPAQTQTQPNNQPRMFGQ